MGARVCVCCRKKKGARVLQKEKEKPHKCCRKKKNPRVCCRKRCVGANVCAAEKKRRKKVRVCCRKLCVGANVCVGEKHSRACAAAEKINVCKWVVSQETKTKTKKKTKTKQNKTKWRARVLHGKKRRRKQIRNPRVAEKKQKQKCVCVCVYCRRRTQKKSDMLSKEPVAKKKNILLTKRRHIKTCPCAGVLEILPDVEFRRMWFSLLLCCAAL